MGFDASYQAVPADCDLIERARREPWLGEMLSSTPWFFANGGYQGKRPWAEADGLWEILCDLERRFPGVAKRNCNMDRVFDLMHFLLSAKRRGEKWSDEDGLWDKAIEGGEIVGEHVRGGQGIFVRWTRSADVELIAVLAEEMTEERLKKHFVAAEIDAGKVYKFPGDWAIDKNWKWVWEYFQKFRAFYMEAGRCGDGVIVCVE